MRIGVAPRLRHYQDSHAVTVRSLPGRTQCVMVLAQEGGQPLLLPLLTEFQRECYGCGGAMQWSTEILRPGRQPGMATPEATPVARHCIRLFGEYGRTAAAQLKDKLKALEGSDCAGTLVSSWTPEEHRGAVLAPVTYGAIPLVVEGRGRCWGRSLLRSS